MQLLILWFSIFLWVPGSDCEQECVKCDGRVVSDDKTCSNCTGDYCFYMNYKYAYPFFLNKTVELQGCFTAPTVFTTGCSKNKLGNTMCICNDGPYCNDVEALPNATDISYLNCTFVSESWVDESYDCWEHMCRFEFTRLGGSGKLECSVEDVQMDMYNFGNEARKMFLPTNACYSIMSDLTYEDPTQICLFPSNKIPKRNGKVLGKTKCYVPKETMEKWKNSTCVGQFCYVSESEFGCISQFDRKGVELKAGLYHLTPFIAPFYICDSDFCNNETLVDKQRYYFPSTYKWNSAFSLLPGAQWLFLCVLLCWQSM